MSKNIESEQTAKAPGEAGELVLEWQPSGRAGSATVTAKLADEVLAVETFNLTKPKQRTNFAKGLADGRPGIDPKDIEAELLDIAAKLTAEKPKSSGKAGGATKARVVDFSQVERPELFHRREVSGAAVPLMILARNAEGAEELQGHWGLLLRWHKTGKREGTLLGNRLEPEKGRPIWFWPTPADPNPATKPGWDRPARKRWVEGHPAPDPADLFRRIAERIAYFIDLPRPQAAGVTATLVCWVIHTYCYPAWPAVPYLYVGGPIRSGKSRVFEVLSRLVWRPLVSSSLTAPSMFRTLHSRGGVLLLDEAERLKQAARDPTVQELMSMLLAGYKKGGTATRLEPLGDGFQTVSFDVFGPKALACIAGLPPALASRCISVTMFRAGPSSPKPRRRIDADPAGWQRLRDDLHALALEHGPTWLELADRDDMVPEGLNGRDFELWQPLLALAWWIETAGARGLLGLLQKHALQTAEAGRDDQTPDHDETLLRLLAESVRCGERPTPGELLDKAKAAEAEAFKRWTARAVAEHLKRYGLLTNKTDGRKRYARVTLDDLLRVETNYSIDLGLNDQ